MQAQVVVKQQYSITNMAPEVTDNLLMAFMKKLGKILVKATEEPKTPQEEFGDFFTAGQTDTTHEQKIDSPLKYVVMRPKVTDEAILQQLEEIKRDREGISKEKEAISKDRTKLKDEQQTLKRSFDEARSKNLL